MKPYSASLVNAVILIGAGAWDYLATYGLSLSSLMPVVTGIVLILLNGGVKKESKIISHIVVLVTLAVAIILVIPLVSSICRADTTAVLRISLMILSGVFAMVYFIGSFIRARRNREEQ